MKQKIMAVCDTEEAYAHRLAEYMLDRVKLPYALHLFTRVEELQKFIDGARVEVLLIAESAWKRLQGESVRQQASQIFVLQESGTPQEEGICCIDKFQSPEAILGEMVEAITDVPAWTRTGSGTATAAKLIGMYSPVKRCLQTTFALTMGQILGREHKTLYINLESYSGFERMLQKEFSVDMSDLMYYFRCARDKLPLRLPSLIQNINGLDYIPPARAGSVIREADGEKWLELCGFLADLEGYEYIILDLDDGMDGLFDLLRYCHKIYTITREDSFAVAKLAQYEQILRFHQMEEIAERTVKCRIPVFREVPAGLEHMTHGELAAYVRMVLKEG